MDQHGVECSARHVRFGGGMSGDGGGALLPVPVSHLLAEAAPHGFFAPVSRDTVDELLKQCESDKQRIESVAQMADGFFGRTLTHFIRGNFRGRDDRPTSGAIETLFASAGALRHLYASYWSKALALTDVYDHMPQARRDAWNKSIQDQDTPAFTAENVIPTLRDLLASRERFLAERVDGVFRNLSGEHVTNSPAGFGQRMIISHLVTSYGTTNHDRVGYINDLRCVIARFMGRDEPKWNASHAVVDDARLERRGEWVTLDGGALRLRAYKCGTAHLEVHQDMAWRLNAILSVLHPQAIPASFRTKPKSGRRSFVMQGRPLPFRVLDVLSGMRIAYRRTDEAGCGRSGVVVRNALDLPLGDIDKDVLAEAIAVIESIGGVSKEWRRYEFDYDPRRTIAEIVATGVIPDQKSHQFFPTPSDLAARAVLAAEIEPQHCVLEPSAGQGNLAALLPADRTTCVEISALHCRILRAKGLIAIQRDFLEWADEQRTAGACFDRIVMNPPFSGGRAASHLEAAQGLLAADGRLVAVLPVSFKGRAAPAGWDYQWSESIDNAFADTSISVVLLVARRTRPSGGD